MATVNSVWASIIRESWTFGMWQALRFRKRRRYERWKKYNAEARSEWERLGKPKISWDHIWAPIGDWPNLTKDD